MPTGICHIGIAHSSIICDIETDLDSVPTIEKHSSGCRVEKHGIINPIYYRIVPAESSSPIESEAGTLRINSRYQIANSSPNKRTSSGYFLPIRRRISTDYGWLPIHPVGSTSRSGIRHTQQIADRIHRNSYLVAIHQNAGDTKN